ncbi:MAG: Gfo/Idh/MocA family oxidoreductase, partial [Candidatus Omnitrophica bacterium]|nr:Gfo/Idh/MocA family oxidoreductase [Candidatus Omnitrophota bacterium]
ITGLLGLLKRPSPIRNEYLNLCTRQIIYSNKKARQILGWSSPKPSADALRETMIYFQSGQTHHRIVDPRIASGMIELSNPANVALVGCGVIAKTHLDILKRIKGVSVVGVVDTNPEAAAALAKEYGLKNAYGSLNELFEKEKVDVIHVLTPPKGRLEIIETAARHGCDVLIEKPFALNADEAEKIVKVVRSKNIKVCVNHNHLFDPPMIEARKLLTSGAVGDVLYAESWYGFNLSANLGSRYMMPGAGDHWSMKLPGKLYQNLFSHPFSVLNEVLGDPKEVLAHAYCGRVVKSMKTDELKVYVKTPNSAGLLTVSLAVNPRYQFLNIYGSNMCLYIDFLNKTLIKHSTPKGIPKAISRALMSISAGWILITSTLRNMFKVMTKSFTYYDGTEILIKEFYRRRLMDEPMPVSVEEGLESMRVMDEVWKQIRI